MIVEFRVRNYRSIKEEQVLSLVAQKDKVYADTHIIKTGIESIPELVQSAVLYGPNASGKTNLLRALRYMQAVVAQSATIMQAGETFNVQPFKLDSKTEQEASEFELTFIHDTTRYQYGFKLTAERIHEEWLLVYKKSKPQEWFTRHYDSSKNKDKYKLGSHLTGQRKLWQESTRANALFLSTAVKLNSEQLLPIFSCIANDIIIFTSDQSPNPGITTQMLQDNELNRTITSFLLSADINISKISILKKKEPTHSVQLDILTGQTKNFQKQEAEIISPLFHHKNEDKEVVFEFADESHGTRRLFSYAGPILKILEQGQTLIIDELDSSLHPLLVKHLINMFHDPKINTKGAQLIFSTHNTSLLDQSIFRRDQVWFVEKKRDGASTLYPLTDFSPRKNEALESGYLMGRYGSIPLLP